MDESEHFAEVKLTRFPYFRYPVELNIALWLRRWGFIELSLVSLEGKVDKVEESLGVSMLQFKEYDGFFTVLWE